MSVSIPRGPAARGRLLTRDPANPSQPWPARQKYQDWSGSTSGGEIIFVLSGAPLAPAQKRALEPAIDDRDDRGQLRRAISKLNHSSLVAARKAAIGSEKSRLDREYRGRRAPPQDRTGLATEMLQRTQYPAFVSHRVAFLLRSIGRGHS